MIARMTADLDAIFDAAGCTGALCAERGEGDGEVALRADELVVAASTIKVLVAVAVVRQIDNGTLDPSEPVHLSSGRRTPGPVGFSLYEHDTQVALGDLLVQMLTLSDNVATDVLIDRAGLAAINQAAVELGLSQTVIVSTVNAMLDGIAQAAGFADWSEMIAWSESGDHSDREHQQVDDRVQAAPQLQPATGTRTTPRDMCLLLREIWTDRAASPEGCRRIRRLMAQQLTRHRLASGFAPPVKVSAKSGGLLGFFRHEVGVIQFPDSWYPAAVFTTSPLGANDAAINAAIGNAAAAAVDSLRAG
jgi:beta-lactamase class A